MSFQSNAQEELNRVRGHLESLKQKERNTGAKYDFLEQQVSGFEREIQSAVKNVNSFEREYRDRQNTLQNELNEHVAESKTWQKNTTIRQEQFQQQMDAGIEFEREERQRQTKVLQDEMDLLEKEFLEYRHNTEQKIKEQSRFFQERFVDLSEKIERFKQATQEDIERIRREFQRYQEQKSKISEEEESKSREIFFLVRNKYARKLPNAKPLNMHEHALKLSTRFESLQQEFTLLEHCTDTVERRNISNRLLLLAKITTGEVNAWEKTIHLRQTELYAKQAVAEQKVTELKNYLNTEFFPQLKEYHSLDRTVSDIEKDIPAVFATWLEHERYGHRYDELLVASTRVCNELTALKRRVLRADKDRKELCIKIRQAYERFNRSKPEFCSGSELDDATDIRSPRKLNMVNGIDQVVVRFPLSGGFYISGSGPSVKKFQQFVVSEKGAYSWTDYSDIQRFSEKVESSLEEINGLQKGKNSFLKEVLQ